MANVARSADLPNAIWPTDNEWDIPRLDVNMQADVVDAPLSRWGRETRKARMRGTWHFYTDDARFERLWSRPQDLLNSACVTTVEPNFSVSSSTPRARALWQTFRKRTLGRLWQSRGVRLIVDLNVAPEYAEMNLLGVPKGWRAWATRGSGDTDLQVEYDRAKQHSQVEPSLFLVYGGNRAARELCADRGWLYVADEASVVRGYG